MLKDKSVDTAVFTLLRKMERPKKVRGLTAEQMARMEREMEVIRCSIS